MGAFEERDAGVGPEWLSHLVAPDIDAGDVGRSGAEERGGDASVKASHVDGLQAAK